MGDFPEFSLAMAREKRFKLEQKARDSIDVKHGNEINLKRWLKTKATSVEPNTINRDKKLFEMYVYPFF